jgi:hypothetical protein
MNRVTKHIKFVKKNERYTEWVHRATFASDCIAGTLVSCFLTDGIRFSGNFDVEVVRNQVKYMGLVEILHIRKAGFTYRGKLEEFLDRYKSLCPDTWPNWKGRFTTAGDAVARLIDHLEYTVEDCKIGKYDNRYIYSY